MAEKLLNLTFAGQEVQRGDENLLGGVAALQDDRVLAELLRLAPYDGGAQGVYKAILGYSAGVALSGIGTSPAPVVQPTGSANGSVLVYPFRAVVGSRNLVNAAPSPTFTGDSDALANWRDVRSGVFVGTSTALAATQAIAANASGNPRWDLVYATIAVDANQNTVVRRVKDPNSGNITTPSVPQYVLSPVTVTVLQGTPAATPAVPTLPADSAGNYNLALAYVRVPNGFGASSTVASTDIRSTILGNNGNPSGPYRNVTSGFSAAPATGNNDASGAYATRAAFQWNAAAGGRPGVFLPPDWIGGHMTLVEIDCNNVSSANWSHNDGDVVDNSVDWRNRMFVTFWQAQALPFGNDRANAGTAMLPSPKGGVSWAAPVMQMGHSFHTDNYVNAASVIVTYGTNAISSIMAPGSEVDLYVDMTTGALKVHVPGGTSPSCRLFFWVCCSAPFPNY